MISKSLAKLVPALGFVVALASCSTIDTFIPHGGDAPVANSSPIRYGPDHPEDKVKVEPLSATDLDCPSLDIADGGATYRVGGPDNKTVRYQFDISNLARDCEPRGAQFALKIGISGLLLIGPAGKPGSYSADLKLLVATVADKKPVYQKTFKIAVDTNGKDRGAFELAPDPILLPLTRTDIDAIYTVTLGLGNTVGVAPTRHRK